MQFLKISKEPIQQDKKQVVKVNMKDEVVTLKIIVQDDEQLKPHKMIKSKTQVKKGSGLLINMWTGLTVIYLDSVDMCIEKKKKKAKINAKSTLDVKMLTQARNVVKGDVKSNKTKTLRGDELVF